MRSERRRTPFQYSMNSIVVSPTYWPMVAALAAPTTPHPATKTKKRSRLRLTALAAALAINGVLQKKPTNPHYSHIQAV